MTTTSAPKPHESGVSRLMMNLPFLFLVLFTIGVFLEVDDEDCTYVNIPYNFTNGHFLTFARITGVAKFESNSSTYSLLKADMDSIATLDFSSFFTFCYVWSFLFVQALQVLTSCLSCSTFYEEVQNKL